MRNNVFLFLSILFLAFSLQAKDYKVLYIGNSYIYTYDVPEIVSNMAASTGDNISFEMNCLGGYTLKQHFTNSTTISLIKQGGWDYVVLQEQSQFPSFPIEQVEAEVFPYAHALDSLIKTHNPCATTIFFMTWGRKNGDQHNCQYFPPLCTYEGMDSLLALRYTMMAEQNFASIAPVGRVWRYIRENHSHIDPYSSDESHQSMIGAYAVATSFYTVFLNKNPENISYSFNIEGDFPEIVRNVTKAVVYDSLDHWHRFNDKFVRANFTYLQNDNFVEFINHSTNGDSYLWDFGDENQSSEVNPTHTYSYSGAYNVKLSIQNEQCSKSDYFEKIVNIDNVGFHDPNSFEFSISPNPVNDNLYINGSIPIAKAEIYNLEGKLLIYKDLSSENNINIKDLNSGIYLLKLTSKTNQVAFSKFIKR